MPVWPQVGLRLDVRNVSVQLLLKPTHQDWALLRQRDHVVETELNVSQEDVDRAVVADQNYRRVADSLVIAAAQMGHDRGFGSVRETVVHQKEPNTGPICRDRLDLVSEDALDGPEAHPVREPAEVFVLRRRLRKEHCLAVAQHDAWLRNVLLEGLISIEPRAAMPGVALLPGLRGPEHLAQLERDV